MRREFFNGIPDDEDKAVKAFVNQNQESALKTKPKVGFSFPSSTESPLAVIINDPSPFPESEPSFCIHQPGKLLLSNSKRSRNIGLRPGYHVHSRTVGGGKGGRVGCGATKAGSSYLDSGSLAAQRLGRNLFLPLELSFATICEISRKMGDGIRYGRWIKQRVRPSDTLSKRTAQVIGVALRSKDKAFIHLQQHRLVSIQFIIVTFIDVFSGVACRLASPCFGGGRCAADGMGLRAGVSSLESQMPSRFPRSSRRCPLPLSSGFMPGCPRILFLEPSRLLVSWVWRKVSLRRLFCFHGSRSELSRVLSPSPDSVLAHSRLTATNFPGLRT